MLKFDSMWGLEIGVCWKWFWMVGGKVGYLEWILGFRYELNIISK